MSGSGRVALLDVREWLGCPPRCPGVVGRPFRKFGRPTRMSGSVQKALPALSDVREWSGDPAKRLEVVGSPPGFPGGLTDVREWSENPPGSLEGPLRCP